MVSFLGEQALNEMATDAVYRP